MSNGLTVFNDFFKDAFSVVDSINQGDYDHKRLNVDWDSNEDGYVIRAELPGIDDENVNINYENGVITIKAEYKEEGKNSLRTGKYRWSARLSDVDVEKINAKLDKGILVIDAPKSEKAKPKQIQISK